jgi:hypothetical protein
VAKTFLIAQLNYAACWLKPSDDMTDSIQLIIDNFIKGPLNISRDCLYREPNLGGVGALNLKTFFQAQRCAWIARAWTNCCDNWRYDLKLLAPNHDISLIRTDDIDRIRHPILYNMVEAFEHLCHANTVINGNYKDSTIFNNPNFMVGLAPGSVIKKNFFGHNR